MAAAIPMAGTPDGGGRRHRNNVERTPPGKLVAFPGEFLVKMRRCGSNVAELKLRRRRGCSPRRSQDGLWRRNGAISRRHRLFCEKMLDIFNFHIDLWGVSCYNQIVK